MSKMYIVAIIVTAEAVACGGPDFEAPLFDGDAGVGGETWSSSSSVAESASSSGGATTSGGSGGYAGQDAGYLGGSGGGSASGGSSTSSSTTTSATSGTGGAEPCGPATCAGCCDAAGDCQVGADDSACGMGGGVCSVCKSQCGWSFPGTSECSTGEGTGVQVFSCQQHACKVEMFLWAGDGNYYDGHCCASPCDVATGDCPP